MLPKTSMRRLKLPMMVPSPPGLASLKKRLSSTVSNSKRVMMPSPLRSTMTKKVSSLSLLGKLHCSVCTSAQLKVPCSSLLQFRNVVSQSLMPVEVTCSEVAPSMQQMSMNPPGMLRKLLSMCAIAWAKGRPALTVMSNNWERCTTQTGGSTPAFSRVPKKGQITFCPSSAAAADVVSATARPGFMTWTRRAGMLCSPRGISAW
mmetsp:Transcript_14004/g.33032  ORF Transcript_14004/g.33032 Transcript_14004/m.33032 type:complete len:204 (+) Transcript_14004:508-1119(+)